MRILRKLTLQYLKMNRTRTIVTIIGIILSIGLIMTIAGLATSAWESSIRSAVRMSGDYDFLLAGCGKAVHSVGLHGRKGAGGV